MYHHSPTAFVPAPATVIRALHQELDDRARASASPLDRRLMEALDACCGAGRWAMQWDEDLAGRPIPGTVCLAWGEGETLVIG